MAKIWLKVKRKWHKKNQIGENGGERKRNPSANPVILTQNFSIDVEPMNDSARMYEFV